MPTSDKIENLALWRTSRRRRYTVGPAAYTRPGSHELVVRTRAVGLNLIDDLPALVTRLVVPWMRFPSVPGIDAAGEVVEIGAEVDGFAVGDRVVGHALGIAREHSRPAEGSFQRYVVLSDHMTAAIPDTLPFAQAAVLPLQLSTAASGMFQEDGLGLELPRLDPVDQGATVLVWGGSTSVGSNAIQLASNAGYRVVATASPRNFDYLRSLGADAVADRSSPTVVDELIAAIGDSPLAGSLAVGDGSLPKVMRVAARVAGSKRIAAAAPPLVTRLFAATGPKGLRVSGIWSGSLARNEVGPAIYNTFLPAALARGDYQAKPDADVVGDGLEAIPAGLRRRRAGLSARKLVVTLGGEG